MKNILSCVFMLLAMLLGDSSVFAETSTIRTIVPNQASNVVYLTSDQPCIMTATITTTNTSWQPNFVEWTAYNWAIQGLAHTNLTIKGIIVEFNLTVGASDNTQRRDDYFVSIVKYDAKTNTVDRTKSYAYLVRWDQNAGLHDSYAVAPYSIAQLAYMDQDGNGDFGACMDVSNRGNGIDYTLNVYLIGYVV